MLKYQGHLYREAKRQYEGPPLEQGGTSIKGPPVAPLMATIKKLISSGMLVPGESRILDAGAGAYSRNADALRQMGFDVYAYDPNHGKDPDGWTGVASSPPSDDFDLAFTSYVLNVVPEYVEDSILSELESMASRVLHITRNKDVTDMITGALYRWIDGKRSHPNTQLVYDFFVNEFRPSAEVLEALDDGVLYEEDMTEFAEYGTETSDGFQRIPVLENKGYDKARDTSGFKLYTKGL